MKKVLYFVKTNGYDMLVSDNGETRKVLVDNNDLCLCDVRNHKKFLKAVEDDSSWEEYTESTEELTKGCEILATIKKGGAKMKIGEIVEELICVKDNYDLYNREKEAVIEACNVLEQLPRLTDATEFKFSEKDEKLASTYTYIVIVACKDGTISVSQEAYNTLEKAQAFVEGRGDKPMKLREYCYQSEEYTYNIYEVKVV